MAIMSKTHGKGMIWGKVETIIGIMFRLVSVRRNYVANTQIWSTNIWRSIEQTSHDVK